MPFSILVVDDEEAVAEFCRFTLADAGYTVFVAHSAKDALDAVERHEIDVVLSDVKMPGTDGLALLRALNMAPNAPDVVLMTAYGSIAAAVEATRLGAYDYIEKPFSPERLETTVQRLAEVRALRAQNSLLRFRLGCADATRRMCGASKSMTAVFEAILSLAVRNQPVLITGETGTGKELIARSIHEQGLSRERPFVAVDCGALVESMVESELFGHVRGAYTGAVGDRRGLLESSRGGTLFLDEVGELPLSLQVKLLRVLQDREFRPLGSDVPRRFEARVIAATNRDLEKAAAANLFRPDLYYRLNVHTIQAPSLRARKSDIPLLIRHFLQIHGEGRVFAVTPEATEVLMAHDWPGNVRELENCIIRMVAVCAERVLDLKDLPQSLRRQSSQAGSGTVTALQVAERSTIVGALESVGGSVAEAARALGVSKATLYRKMVSHGLRQVRCASASGSGPVD